MFFLAVSGGTAPWHMFAMLDSAPIEWRSVAIYQVDERVAPAADPDRNLARLRASLPPAAHDAIRPMPVEDGDLDAAAARYEGELPERLDLVHLGLGPDGHTASLVPGDPVLEVGDRRVAATSGEYQGRRRMTLTYPAIEAARSVLWLVTGADKRDPLAKLIASDPSIPAGRVRAADATLVTDEALL